MSSELKDLPLNWEWKKIKDVLSLKNGRYLPKKKHIKDGDYKVYGANGVIGRYNEFYIKEKTLSIGRVGACGEINKVESNTWVTDNAMYVEKYNEKLVLLDFLYYLLDSMNIGQFSSKSSQPSINQSTIKNLDIPVPPLEEQKQIVIKLDELFSSVDSINKLQNDANKIGKNIMSSSISSILKLNKIFEKNNIPKKWKIKTIKDVVEYSSDSLKPIDYPNKEFNYLGLKNIESNSGQIIDLEKTKGKDIKSRKREFNGTNILYGKLRPYLNKVAVPDFNGVCSTDILVLKAKKIVLKEYVYYYLLSKYVVDKTTELMSGTNLPRIRKNDFMNLQIPIPPLTKQKEIINKLNQINNSVNFIIKQQGNRDSLLGKLPQSILEKAFAGEL
ncbi:restriction endonuclease subunit S [Halanaerobium congolense]|jgi:type I restriction enzyme S subunit|uniref:Type I restriction enzyme, S subunit n=1 Tax=Halanaerobium congolense TaxID=54121 RepID=A0A1G6QGN5_9FIRM|nr:restriction endonuclease subunit S [Halanaerobium congolense]SDC91559.1 type I restriction enzyme, S subunit [Halanaerobium congolense]